MNKFESDLLDSLDVVDEYTKPEYEMLHWALRITRVTEKAALFGNKHWIPKSLLRCDPDGNFWVEKWFADKNL